MCKGCLAAITSAIISLGIGFGGVTSSHASKWKVWRPAIRAIKDTAAGMRHLESLTKAIPKAADKNKREHGHYDFPKFTDVLLYGKYHLTADAAKVSKDLKDLHVVLLTSGKRRLGRGKTRVTLDPKKKEALVLRPRIMPFSRTLKLKENGRFGLFNRLRLLASFGLGLKEVDGDAKEWAKCAVRPTVTRRQAQLQLPNADKLTAIQQALQVNPISIPEAVRRAAMHAALAEFAERFDPLLDNSVHSTAFGKSPSPPDGMEWVGAEDSR